MSLIKKIYQATQSGALPQPFTAEQMKVWMKNAAIVQDNGSEYAKASINSILSNSDNKNSPTTNKNRKVLFGKINARGKKEYWFQNNNTRGL